MHSLLLGAIAIAAAWIGASQPAWAQSGPGLSVPQARNLPGARAPASATQSAWVRSHESSARLVAGAAADDPQGIGRLFAGVELRMSEGWKTYWRHPGDDGGLPPTFDWSASRNLASAQVLYPAPKRMKTKTGTSIGYAGEVVFPVEIEPADRSRPVEIVLKLEYGICREICVPAEVTLRLVIAPALAIMPAALASALASVPRSLDAKAAQAAGLPRLAGASAALKGPEPSLVFEVAAGEDAAAVDLFVEAPEGLYLPMTAKVGPAKAGVQRFRVDLKGVEDAAKLPGKALRLTLTGPRGATEATWSVR